MIGTEWIRQIIYDGTTARTVKYSCKDFPNYYIKKEATRKSSRSEWRGHGYSVFSKFGTDCKYYGTFYRLAYAKSYVKFLYLSEDL